MVRGHAPPYYPFLTLVVRGQGVENGEVGQDACHVVHVGACHHAFVQFSRVHGNDVVADVCKVRRPSAGTGTDIKGVRLCGGLQIMNIIMIILNTMWRKHLYSGFEA